LVMVKIGKMLTAMDKLESLLNNFGEIECTEN